MRAREREREREGGMREGRYVEFVF